MTTRLQPQSQMLTVNGLRVHYCCGQEKTDT
jgi:hypothetical protein